MKRVVGISAFTYDLIGARTIYIEPDAYEQMTEGMRRATRTKTLDGGAVVYDAGYAHADRTLSLKFATSDRTLGNWVAYMGQTYNLIRISTDSGVFSAVPSQWSERNGNVHLTALVMEKLSA